MPKQNTTATMEGTTIGRPSKRWWEEVEEDLTIKVIKKMGRQWSETTRKEGRLYWKPRSTTDCSICAGDDKEATQFPLYKLQLKQKIQKLILSSVLQWCVDSSQMVD
jgi:hypothetical protein